MNGVPDRCRDCSVPARVDRAEGKIVISDNHIEALRAEMHAVRDEMRDSFRQVFDEIRGVTSRLVDLAQKVDTLAAGRQKVAKRRRK